MLLLLLRHRRRRVGRTSFLMEAPFAPNPTNATPTKRSIYCTALRSRPSLLLFLFLCLASGARGGEKEGRGKETLDYLQPTLLFCSPLVAPLVSFFLPRKLPLRRGENCIKLRSRVFFHFLRKKDLLFSLTLPLRFFLLILPKLSLQRKEQLSLLFRFAAVKGFLVLTDCVSFSFFFFEGPLAVYNK